MKRFDADASGLCAVPPLLLMENAGRGAADCIVEHIFLRDCANRTAIVIAGVGNNGGDGLVVARHLHARKVQAIVYIWGDTARMSEESQTMLRAWIGVGGTVHFVQNTTWEALRCDLKRADLIVDALFGIGLNRKLEPAAEEIVKIINQSETRCVSLDLPSGLDADTGLPFGASVRADWTLTFGHWKRGLATPPGADFAGSIFCVDLGFDAERVKLDPTPSLLEESDITQWLVPRRKSIHKGGAGHLAIFAGSPGKIGASSLCGRAALRAGAGLVTLCTWAEALEQRPRDLPELMTYNLTQNDLENEVDYTIEGKKTVAIGPGFGFDADALRVVEYVLTHFNGACVIDADALRFFENRDVSELSIQCHAILTPHPREAGRILGIATEEVEANRFEAAQRLVQQTGATVVLKGAHTIVAAPDGRMAVSPFCVPALATAGSGDVLTGILAAQAIALPPFEAACTAVYLHGLVGRRWSLVHGDRGLLASEIAELLPEVISNLMKNK